MTTPPEPTPTCPAGSLFDVVRKICVPKTSPSGGTNTSVGQDTGSESQSIKVIQYGGKYLPLDQLIIENEEGCGAEHYHAARGVVLATDGTSVPDPGPQCGYGKVSERPAMTVEVAVPQ